MFRFLQWKSMARRERFEAGMREEFAFHHEARIEHLIRQGATRQEAARRARLEFGAPEAYREECREAHRLHLLDELVRNLRYGFRNIKKNPGFAATAIVSLALGIGMNTVVFSVFESLLLRPLPIEKPKQVVFVETRTGTTLSFPSYRDFRDNNSTFSGLAGFRISPVDLQIAKNPQRVWGCLATGNYFDMLGLKPALGRFFHPQDDLRAGASPYAVLSYRTWQARFASNPAIAGQTVRINGLPYTVLGVAPANFHSTELLLWPDLWIPMTMEPQIETGNPWLDNRHTWNTSVIGRLKPGVTATQATADLDRIANDLARRFPDSDRGLRMKLSKPGLWGSLLRGPVTRFVEGLLLLAGMALLTTCVNLAGLLLARASDRQREMAIRSSVGAGAGRIIRQVLTESSLISLMGGFAGFAVAAAVCRFLSGWRAPVDFPVEFDVTPDWRVFLFAGMVSVLTGILFSLGPAVQMSRVDLNSVLKGGTVFRPRWGVGFRDFLVAAEIALCFVLVFGSLLSIQGLRNALSMPLGFNPEDVTTLAFDVGPPSYNEAQGRAFQEAILKKVEALPGVISAAYANSLPLSIDQSTTGVQSDGQAIARGREAKSANYYQISPGLLETLRISLLNGRDFSEHDSAHAPQIAIVNQTFAEKIMHTDNPVGKTFRFGLAGGPRIVVAGLVADGKYVSLTERPTPVVFWPIEQQYNSTTTLVVRSHLPSSEIVNDVRRLIASMDSRLPVYGAGSLDDMLGFALFPMHAAAVALSAFGLLALALAITGINGLVSYAMSRRTKEIGIRISVGASSFEIGRFLLTKLAVFVLIGLAVGLLLALAAGQALHSVVYGASPKDPALFCSVLSFLLAAAALACWRPTARALRVDPVRALRYE
ncbi:MAG TPA: ABC transporter permease [Bryobacteraceae bacterium]|jgi:predicted permease|nr:ABC transporter permease [Bryobacteraceae bacterium]